MNLKDSRFDFSQILLNEGYYSHRFVYVTFHTSTLFLILVEPSSSRVLIHPRFYFRNNLSKWHMMCEIFIGLLCIIVLSWYFSLTVVLFYFPVIKSSTFPPVGAHLQTYTDITNSIEISGFTFSLQLLGKNGVILRWRTMLFCQFPKEQDNHLLPPRTLMMGSSKPHTRQVWVITLAPYWTTHTHKTFRWCYSSTRWCTNRGVQIRWLKWYTCYRWLRKHLKCHFLQIELNNRLVYMFQ